MAKEKDEKESVKKLVAVAPSVDFPVEVVATESDPYHETGTKFTAGTKKAAELVKRGWVKMATMIALLIAASFTIQAQNNDFYNPLQTAGVYPKLDTVTNTATAFLSTRLLPQRPFSSAVIWVTVTKISGTVGGTITLQGSIDGTNWKALNTNDTQTALATVTATDASNTYHWRLLGGYFPYYRVSWTGTGTMSASFSAKLFRN